MVVNIVCCLDFLIVLSSSPINNFRWHSSVALSHFIGCLYNDVYDFECFLSLHHLVANYVKNVDERGLNIMCVRTLPRAPSCLPILSIALKRCVSEFLP